MIHSCMNSRQIKSIQVLFAVVSVFFCFCVWLAILAFGEKTILCLAILAFGWRFLRLAKRRFFVWRFLRLFGDSCVCLAILAFVGRFLRLLGDSCVCLAILVFCLFQKRLPVACLYFSVHCLCKTTQKRLLLIRYNERTYDFFDKDDSVLETEKRFGQTRTKER